MNIYFCFQKTNKLFLCHTSVLLFTRTQVLLCPSYIANLALTNYYHIRFLQNLLADEKVHYRKGIKKFLEPFFASKSPEFYANGIAQLPLRWQEVINSNGELISQ
ncbi:unnamed protein product [Caenorhabditis nigoni]